MEAQVREVLTGLAMLPSEATLVDEEGEEGLGTEIQELFPCWAVWSRQFRRAESPTARSRHLRNDRLRADVISDTLRPIVYLRGIV